MTTRNFRVNNGLSVGDITISASANTISGLATAAPSADGDVSNKKYVDDSIAAISTTAITQGNSNVTVADSGTGNITIEVDGTDRITTVAATTTTATGHSLVIGAGSNSAAGQIKFLEGTDNGTNGVTLIGPASTGDVTVTLPAASDTLVGKATTDTFTNKTIDANGTGNSITNIDSGNFLSGFFKDEDDMTSDSATSVASQQSIKAYVDTEIGNISTAAISAGNSSATISDTGSDGALTVVCDGNTELVVNDTNATFSGNVVISGNLTTNGTTVTNSSTNTTIEDALIELGSGNTGSNANDLGLILERGSTGNNGFMGWDESEDKFIVGTTTGTGASTGNLTITTGTLVANIEGNVTGNVTGNTSGSSGSCTGNAATATALASARNIGGVSFDGTGNINLPGVNTGGNQDTSGNAATATALETARNIGGVSFNGTANINLPGVNTAGNQNTSGTAAIATAITAADESSDTSCNVLFVTAATGDLPPKTGTNLTFNSSSGVLTATGFAGALTGNVTGNCSGSSGSCTGNSATASVATTVTITDNESTNENNPVVFVAGGDLDGGNLGLESDGTCTYNPSTGKITATGFVGDLTGTASAAEYSDVAERFASDTTYEPGTVVALGGSEEITQVNEEGSDEVFGVVSSLKQAAFKMNAGAGDDDTHPYIAMTGRVNVKVIGTVNKGDRLISASVPGYAKAATKAECTAFNVIGRALTSKTIAGQGSVLAAVRVSH